MTLSVRQATVSDASRVVDLFSQSGNPHQWSIEKWSRYYCDYPEGDVVAFIVESESDLLGHYGLFPVTIGKHRVYMGAHAYVSETARGLAVISTLMRAVDEFCRTSAIPFIVGFANPRFTTVKSRLFGWHVLLYAEFMAASSFNPACYRSRPYQFQYSGNWLQWRFGVSAAPVLSQYPRAGDACCANQLLYADDQVNAKDYGLDVFECWSPEGYYEEAGAGFRQPFSIRVYDDTQVCADLLAPENWLIQMGDSDTFVYRAG